MHNSRVFDNILKKHHVVGRVQQIRESEVDLALSGGRDLVVMAFNVDSDIGQDQRYRIAKIDQRVDRSHRYITFLCPNVIAEVRIIFASLSAGVPMAFLGIDREPGRVLIVMEFCTVEDKELSLRANVYRVRDSVKRKVAFRTKGDRTRVEAVAFLSNWLDHIRDQANCGLFGKGVDPDPRRIRG